MCDLLPSYSKKFVYLIIPTYCPVLNVLYPELLRSVLISFSSALSSILSKIENVFPLQYIH